MIRLEQLTRNRNRLFWSLHALGWAAYASAQYLGALLYRESQGYIAVISIATVVGFLVSAPLRYLYRRLWTASPRAIVIGALVSCYLIALPYRALINNTFRVLVEPDWKFENFYEVFSGTLSTTYLLLCWSGLYFGIKYYESLQLQREAALRATALAHEAQLKMLRYQLNPHYLFNTLNAISTLVLDNRNDVAVQAVTRLSDFLRYSLDQDPMKKVTLRQELEALELYLSTERLRFGTRLAVHFDIEPAAREARIPSLLLQPLIENALKYAIAPREHGGSIEVQARTRESLLLLAVSDDGPGMAAAQLEQEAQGRGRGVGLRNTRERLAVLYGNRQRFALRNLDPGLRVELDLPMEVQPA